MSVEHYDLAIIGSGSGNSVITESWDDKKVAIIDSGVFGGTCLNKGCIPTKMYVYPSTLASTPAPAAEVNVDVSFNRADWSGLRDRVFSRIDAISDSGRAYRDEELEHTTLIAEEVHFTGPRQLTSASGRVIEAEQIVIAAGSRPRIPDVPGVDLPQVHTSDTVMRLEQLPEHILIIGGGYIAAEFAAIFSGLGSTVHQVNRSPRLLRHQDEEISAAFTQRAQEQWQLTTGYTLNGIRQTDGDQVVADFTAVNTEENSADQSQSADLSVQTDVVLIATGRVPNTDRLNLTAAGIDTNEHHRISTDPYLRVLSNGEVLPGVWALGDITNDHQLKHVANHEQRVVNHNMDHPDQLKPARLDPVPAAVFSRPQIASAGLTEAQARAQYGDDDLTIKVQQYADVAYGWAMGDAFGFVKLIAQRSTGTLLGAHLIGEDASNLIQPLVQAMSLGIDAHTMARGQYWIHPALAEVVENALLGLEVPDSGLV